MQVAEQTVLAWLDKMPVRLTRLRVSVARALLQERQPPTAEVLYRRLDEWGESTSLGSVYRILKEWEDAGLLQREWQVSALGNKAVYLLKGDPRQKQSYTLRCTACGRQQRVADPAVAAQVAQACHLGGYTLPAEIVVAVRCASCGDRGAAASSAAPVLAG